MFKQASRLKLRFQTTKGLLSVEQLWDLSMADLTKSIKSLSKTLNKKEDDNLSFLNDVDESDPIAQLQFDILKDIYVTKKSEADAARTAKETKEHNQRILQLIADKKDKELEGKSVEELEAMLK